MLLSNCIKVVIFAYLCFLVDELEESQVYAVTKALIKDYKCDGPFYKLPMVNFQIQFSIGTEVSIVLSKNLLL